MFSKLFKRNKGPEFISGRVATKDDVKFGYVCLVDDLGEPLSIPYKVTIPQSVIHINKETNEKSKGLLIQSELVVRTKMKGSIICTLRLENGELLHCLLEELQLSKNKF